MNVETPLISMGGCQPLLIFWQEMGEKKFSSSSVESWICLHWLSPAHWVLVGLCAAMHIHPGCFALQRSCQLRDVTHQEGIQKGSSYSDIVWLFFLLSLLLTKLPSTCQLQNEYSYNAEKQGNSLEQKIFLVFRKLSFSSTTAPTSLQSGLQADLVGYLHVWTDLGGVRLPGSLGCPTAEVHWCLMCRGWEACL